MMQREAEAPPVFVMPGLSGPPIEAGAATGGPGEAGHDGEDPTSRRAIVTRHPGRASPIDRSIPCSRARRRPATGQVRCPAYCGWSRRDRTAAAPKPPHPGNTRPGIRNLEPHHPAAGETAHRHTAAARGEFQCVVDKVGHSLEQQVRVAAHHHRTAVGSERSSRTPFASAIGSYKFDRVGHHLAKVRIREPGPPRAAFHLGNPQDRGEVCQHVLVSTIASSIAA